MSRRNRALRGRSVGAPTRHAAAANLLKQASALHVQGQLLQSEALYREVLRVAPDNFDARHLLGVIALQTRRYDEGVRLIAEALSRGPQQPRALANLGNGYLLLNRPVEALQSYDRALMLAPAFAGALSNRGNALQMLGRHGEAAATFARLLEIEPAFDFAAGNCFQSRRFSCDWRAYEAQRAEILDAISAGRRADRPFALLSVSGSAEQQLHCARLYAAYLVPRLGAPLWNGERYRHGRIRVAYVSADFRDHIVTHLMASLYERHDAGRFDTIGIALGADDTSPVLQRARHALGRFETVAHLNDEAAAQRIRALEVDIAVDLTGFTQGCRPGIFARRPAPVQVNFLGFPATMGVPYIDYLIADEFVVPEHLEPLYAEKIARLPHSFQASDDRRSALAAAPAPSRADVGLPDAARVLCSCNSSSKLNPEYFGIWLRLLRGVPGSVLWLMGQSADAREHLRREAVERGVDAARLVFGERVPYAAHLARLPLADLFLDSLPFNAGATASDALWAGLPVLTCVGEAFASRMAGSLLRAIGCCELITHDAASYERRAFELLTNPNDLRRLRRRLIENRSSHALFDSERYCRHFEAALTRMWQLAEDGEPPQSFAVGAA
jgi:predicted O-linked N-acetylglucosamine transferase (SPINDLY family)